MDKYRRRNEKLGLLCVIQATEEEDYLRRLLEMLASSSSMRDKILSPRQLVDEIELVRSQPDQCTRLSSHVSSILSDVGLVTHIERELELFPWSLAVSSHFKRHETRIFELHTADYRPPGKYKTTWEQKGACKAVRWQFHNKALRISGRREKQTYCRNKNCLCGESQQDLAEHRRIWKHHHDTLLPSFI